MMVLYTILYGAAVTVCHYSWTKRLAVYKAPLTHIGRLALGYAHKQLSQAYSVLLDQALPMRIMILYGLQSIFIR